MKYSQKYPCANPIQMVEDTIMCGCKLDSCYVCGMLTNFIDIDFEAHICSEECEEKLVNEFFRYVKKFE